MGTSAFDIINKGIPSGNVDLGTSVNTPSVSSVPISTSTQPKSAFDLIDPTKVEPTFSNAVGNSAKFMGSVLSKNHTFADLPSDVVNYASNANKGIDSASGNIAKSMGDLSDYLLHTPVAQAQTDLINKVKSLYQDTTSGSLGDLLSQAGQGLVSQGTDFVEAASQLKNENGVAVPISPDDLAKKFQSVAGTLAMGEVAKLVHGSLLPTSFDNSTEAIAAKSVSKIGKLAKVVGTDVAAGASGGAIQGLIANMGDSDAMAKSLAGALTFAPLGAVFGLFKIKAYTRDINVESARLTNKSNASSIPDLAENSAYNLNNFDDPSTSQQIGAVNSMRADNGYNTLPDLAHSIDAIGTSDNVLSAAIKAKLSVGKGYVVEGIQATTSIPEFPNASVYHSPARDVLAVSPFPLDKSSEMFFKLKGFLPYEMVNHGGIDHYVTDSFSPEGIEIVDMNTGKSKIVDPSEVRRTNTSPVSNLITSNDGVAVDQMGVFNSTNALEQNARGFPKFFKQKANAGLAFDDVVAKYAQQNGISNVDLPIYHAALYKVMSEDLASTTLTPREKMTRIKVTSGLIDSNLAVKSAMSDLYNSADANQMYVQADGAGRYSIHSTQDNTLIGHAGTPEEALKVINNSGQTNGVDLDGGGTGGIKTSLGNNGSFNQAFSPVDSQLSKAVDLIRGTSVGQFITPVVRWWESVDNLNQGKTSFLKPLLYLQDLQNKHRSYISSEGKPLIDGYNALNTIFKGVGEDRKAIVTGYSETLSPQEVMADMKPDEIATASKFKDVNTNDVTDLISKISKDSKSKFGSLQFNEALTSVKGTTLPDVWNATMSLNNDFHIAAPDSYSPFKVLKLAKVSEDLGTALSKEDYIKTHNLNPLEIQAGNSLSEFQNQSLQRAALDPNLPVHGTLPDIKIHDALGFENSNIQPAFGKQLAAIGIVKEGTERNPIVQANRYVYTALQHGSGMLDGINKAQEMFSSELENIENNPDPNIAKGAPLLQEKFQQHLDDIRGIPNLNDSVANFIGKLGKTMGFTPAAESALGMFSVKNATSLFSVANLALRPALAVRDVHNAYLQAFTRYGLDFANKAFSKAISSEDMELLQKNGVIPNLDYLDIQNPVGNKDLISKNSVLNKGAEIGFKYSGQEGAYNRSLAGIYLATHEDVMSTMKDLRENVLNKEQAYDKLKLSAQSPTVQRIFDDFIQAGKPDQAADFLGRYRGRELSNIFGNSNNPQGWKSNFGRLMGQYGSYTANAMNTYVDNITRGSFGDISGRVMRGGIGAAATAAAGSALGLNLNSWQIANPFNNFIEPGPLTTLIPDAAQTAQQSGVGAAAWKVGSDFFPYHRALSGWQDAYEKGNPLAAFGFKLEK